MIFYKQADVLVFFGVDVVWERSAEAPFSVSSNCTEQLRSHKS